MIRILTICSWFIGIWLAAAPTSARAECLVCDNMVEMDDFEATCYLTEFGTIMSELEAAPSGRSAISLTACAEEQRKRARGGLDLMPSPKLATTPDETRDSTFVLDADGALCLYDLIAKAKRPIDPAMIVDLSKECVR